VRAINSLNKYRIILFSSVSLFNVILLFIPLTSIFGYEFSVLNGILFFIISGLLFINDPDKIPLTKVISALVIAPLIPPVISIIYTLFSVKCSLWDGTLFYLVITVPLIIFGAASGLFCWKVLPKYPKALFFFLIMIISLIPLGEFYFNPQIYFYNLFAGYFPGTIYDEAISVTGKLLIYRFFNFLFFALLLYIILKKSYSRNTISACFVLFPLIFILLSPMIGFSTTKGRIEKELGRTCITEHFEIIYDKSLDATLLKTIILHHEFYYNELKKFYRTESSGKIVSFLFKNSTQKGLLFGAENADVAKPWLGQIYTIAANYNTTLKHEISHIFSASMGTGIFKVAKGINPALIEGIAVASDPFYGNIYIDQLAATAHKYKYDINLQEIYGGFSFFGNASSISYVYSGSFSNYLIQKNGIDRFGKWYSGEPFDSVYGYSIKNASEEYYNFLKGIKISLNENTAKLFFAHQTIFSKICPRYIASKLKKGTEALNEKRFDDAENIYKEILEITPNYSALTLLAKSLIKEKKEKEALELVIKNISYYKNGAYIYGLNLLLADLFILNDKLKQADSLYKQISYEKPDINFKFISELRLKLSESSDLKRYLLGSDSIKYSILSELNKNGIVYCSIPALLNAAENIGIKKDEVVRYFDSSWSKIDSLSYYSAYLISVYLLEYLDFEGSRKFAALAYKYNPNGAAFLLRSHYLKSEWIYINHEEILKKIIYRKD